MNLEEFKSGLSKLLYQCEGIDRTDLLKELERRCDLIVEEIEADQEVEDDTDDEADDDILDGLGLDEDHQEKHA